MVFVDTDVKILSDDSFALLSIESVKYFPPDK